ncbi:MAG: HAMP domain-containing histidine kinase, partial [Leptonema sp. (in: Bacteria)]|nr:HAMP domain-containing histidine kinase [Leptonema sp. (in: bacteria)]
FFLGAVALHLARHQLDLEQISKRSDTEKKRAERRKAEAIYNVSHEFQFHFDGIKESLSEKSKKINNQHLASLDRLLHDAKLLSQIESGSYDLRQSRFSIKEQADFVINQVIQVTGERSSRLKLMFPPESERFWSDITLFKTCLFHIVENAILYSNGQISVHIEVIDGNLQVSVKDEGPGISVEIQNRIFDKFFRTAGLKQPGSGIGLTLTRLAVELLDGELQFESGPGFYTVFDLTLPEMQEVPV